ncbi:MAG TPA: hypothetical protein VGN83_25420 [Falsiroseomonas sp.]|jgi:hypothetical protein|nr:hypothetical protein [Falsiroseomonas sp.]
MRPIAQCNGHDARGLIDEAVPGKAAVVDDVVHGGEKVGHWSGGMLCARVEHEVADCLAAVENRRRGDLAKGLRDYRDYLDSRARDGGLIAENDPYRSGEEEVEGEEET